MKPRSRDLLEQIPHNSRFSELEAGCIRRHHHLLLSWTDALVENFYQTVSAHPATAAKIPPDQLAVRQRMLGEWWKRTIEGPLDNSYWDWMMWVGLVHIRMQISLPMLQGMWRNLQRFIYIQSHRSLPPEQAEELYLAFASLILTSAALVGEAYLEHYLEAISEQTGLSRSFMDVLAQQGLNKPPSSR